MTESCFLPGTKLQFAWDSTSLTAFKTCARLYQLSIIDGWQSKKDSIHLAFGITYHHAMQNYDMARATGISHDDAVHDVIREALIESSGWDFDHEKKTRPNLIRAIIWYLDQYKDEQSTTYILADGKPAVELSFRFELLYGPHTGAGKVTGVGEQGVEFASQPYLLCGHLDKVIEYSGALYIRDYKTVWSFFYAKWEPDNQMSFYTFASKIVLDTPVAGVQVDMVNIDEEPKFKREITQRTPDQLAEWTDDLRLWLDLAEQYALADYWPQNDTSCGKYGGCKFREVCSKSPAVRHHFLKSDFVQLPPEQRWNPLQSRG